MIVVSNATPIIALSSINKIDILKQMFENIYIPRAVYNEIKAKKIGLVSELKPLLNELINKGNWYSKKVYNIFLKEAGE